MALLALASAPVVSGCGGSAYPGAYLRPAVRHDDADGDEDGRGMGPWDGDRDAVLTYGPEAGRAERAAIESTLSGFYAAAAAGDGARGCSMLYRLAPETVVEEHSHGRGPPALRGSSCPEIAGKLFRSRHGRLVRERAALKVGAAEVRAGKAWVVLRFAPGDERIAMLHREGAGWKLDSLLTFAAL